MEGDDEFGALYEFDVPEAKGVGAQAASGPAIKTEAPSGAALCRAH